MKFESIKGNNKLTKFATNEVKNLYSIKGGYGCEKTNNSDGGKDHRDITGPDGHTDGYGGGPCC